MLALAGECGGCLITGLICVFCCHPCIYDFLVVDMNRATLNRINAAFFQGRVVFSSATSQSIVVNTDNIVGMIVQAPYVSQAMPPYAAPLGQPQPQYAQAQAYPPQQQQQQQQLQYAQAVSVQEVKAPRSMTVTIPEGTPTGAILNIQSPDGLPVQVSGGCDGDVM